MQHGIDMNSLLNPPQQSSLQDLHFDPISADHDFLDQMFSSIPPTSCSWPDLNPSDDLSPSNGTPGDSNGTATFNQIGAASSAAAAAKAMMLQQQMLMMARGFDRSHSDVQGGQDDSVFNGFGGSLALHGGSGQSSNHAPQFPHPQGATQSFAAQAPVTKPGPAASGSTGGGGNGQPKQRVRARRGQATDPHSIAERLRRERIAERMKALQELIPNSNKTDKASMLDEIIDYLKFLQLQVKVLSMSRLGSAVNPRVAESGGGAAGDRIQGSSGGGGGGACSDNSLSVTEHQVAKLLEEDMGSAMQFLQGKGLCLMPISLATAMSTATCRNPAIQGHGDGPTSPNMSALTVQSAAAANGGSEGSLSKDGASVSKP